MEILQTRSGISYLSILRIPIYRVFLVIATILPASLVYGQTNLTGVDSIPISRPDDDRSIHYGFYDGEYRFYDGGDREISLQKMRSEMVSHEKRSILAEISANVITDLTGYPFVSSLGANWKISGNITSNDLLPDWNVSLYCRGAVETERENRDGLLSVESQEVNVYNWEKGASGIIVEGNDTIGFFIITVNPLEDILLKPHVTEVFPDTKNGRAAKPKIRVSASWIPSPGVDYGIVGKIGDRNLMIIRNGINRKVWIYLDDHLHCLYQSDINETGISKKYRIIPYFLMGNDIPRQERYDLFRLAWVSRMLSKFLDPYPSL